MAVHLNAQDDLSLSNDEFNDAASFQNWTSFHESEGWPNHALKADINTTSTGHFYLEPNTGFWYGEVHCGPYYFKKVKGDFTVTTRVKVTGRETSSPQQLFSLAGLMIRSPRPELVSKEEKKQENWLFLTTGYAKAKKPSPQFETKVTINSKSELIIYPAKSGWIELAVTRVQNQFVLSYRYEEDNWTYLRKIEHPNMQEEVQVGFLSYTDFNGKMKRRYVFSKKKLNTSIYEDGNPDVKAYFDYIRFTQPLSAKKDELVQKVESDPSALDALLNLE